jgi:hypothetical protein
VLRIGVCIIGVINIMPGVLSEVVEVMLLGDGSCVSSARVELITWR